MEGKYAREYATTCSPYDYVLFRKLTRHLYMRHPNTWVRRVEVGDIITSKTKILRWKIVEDPKTKQLYLGFVEAKECESGYRHGNVSMYIIMEWTGGEKPRYDLVRMPTGNVNDVL